MWRRGVVEEGQVDAVEWWKAGQWTSWSGGRWPSGHRGVVEDGPVEEAGVG